MNTKSSWSQNLSTHRKLAIQHLIHGRELASQLKMVIGKPTGGGGSVVVADELVMKILGSFTETLSILNPGFNADEACQAPAGARRKWDDLKTEDSDESSKTSVLKDRRGTYKRRKTTDTWTKDTPTLADDGHAWRKYGQKIIHHAKYPRNYYRCTHKFDQGCQATKQVQRTQDEPAMYKTTYHGHHTCRNLQKCPQIMIDSTTQAEDSSFLLSFSAPAAGNGTPVFRKSNDHQYFPNLPHLTKQEDCCREEKLSLDHNNQSSPSDYMFTSDLTTYSDHADVISSGVYSCTASTHDSSHALDMEDLIGSVDFNDVLPFEF